MLVLLSLHTATTKKGTRIVNMICTSMFTQCSNPKTSVKQQNSHQVVGIYLAKKYAASDFTGTSISSGSSTMTWALHLLLAGEENSCI